MTTVARTPDPTRCPGCRATLTARIRCTSCGIDLDGPPALRLWEIDTELLRLDGHRNGLVSERSGLLAQLRAGRVPAQAGSSAPAGSPAWPAAPGAEWTPQRVQNTLLSLGGLLLVVAALVFTAVTYDRLGAGGRAAVLLALTVLAGLAVPQSLRRGLTATAETLTAVTLVLAALDAYGLRKLGLAEGATDLLYAAGSAAVLSAAAAAYAWAVPVRLAGGAAVVLAQLPVPLVLADREPSAALVSLWLAALAAADLGALAALPGRVRRHVPVVLAACAGIAGTAGLLAALTEQAPGPAAVALLVLAAVLVGAGLLTQHRGVRLLVWAAPVLLLATAAYDLGALELSVVQRPLVLVAVGLLAAQAAALLPTAHRPGPVVGGLVVAGAAVVAVGESAVSGLLLPLTWLVDPWSLRAGLGARDAVGTGGTWDGSLVTPVVLGAAAVTVGVAGLALSRRREALVAAAFLAAAAAVLLPLGLALSLPAALTVLLVLAVGLLAAGTLTPASLTRASSTPVSPSPADSRLVRLALTGGGTGVALLAAAWSLADQQATLTVLLVAALALAGAASRDVAPGPLAGLAAALGTAELVAVGAARELSAAQVGGLLLVAVAALAGGAWVLDRARSRGVEAVAVGAGVLAVTLAVGDVGWLSWVLAGTALVALATALRPDRRSVAVVGGLLLSASSWVRLADAGVDAPEPYVLPLAAVALVLGHLRRRAVPGTRSWQAYAPGLSVLLVPSLLASFDDDTVTRALLVGAVALAVLLVGARQRLQAPLAIGGAVLAVDALQLLWPVAAALPRWSTIGAAGTLLVVVGATYEQRRREVTRLRGAYDSLA